MGDTAHIVLLIRLKGHNIHNTHGDTRYAAMTVIVEPVSLPSAKKLLAKVSPVNHTEKVAKVIALKRNDLKFKR